MRKINYPLIISDFDGTLVRKDGKVSDKSKAIIRRYIQDGGKFAISTGRMPEAIISRAKELGLTGVVCCGQGAAIVDIETKKVLYEGTICNEVAVAICQKMEEMGLHIHVYDLWEYYSNVDDDALKMYENIVKAKAKLITDKPISIFVKESGMQPFKILAMVAPEDNERVRLTLDKEGFKGCSVTRSSIYLVEVGNAQCSKGTSVEFLAATYEIPLEKTIAIGDQLNDLSMIQTAGLGIAVKNADEALKAHAVTIDYTNEEDAVAEIIEKYGYMEA